MREIRGSRHAFWVQLRREGGRRINVSKRIKWRVDKKIHESVEQREVINETVRKKKKILIYQKWEYAQLPETVHRNCVALSNAKKLIEHWNWLHISYCTVGEKVLYMRSGHSLSISYRIFFHIPDTGPRHTEYLKS